MQLNNKNGIRLVFLTSFEYPSRYAHPIHGFFMARFLDDLLGDKFLFIYSRSEEKFNLGSIQARAAFPVFGNLIKKFRLRALMYSVWLLFFSWNNFFKTGKKCWVLVIDPKLATILSILKPVGRFLIIFESHQKYSLLTSKMVYNFVDKHIFITHALRKQAAEQYSEILDKSIVLPSAVDFDAYEKIKKTSVQIRDELSLPKNKTIIGYTGRFKPMGFEKGVSKLIKAISFLESDFILCCLGGTTIEIEEYKIIAKNNSVSNRVIFIPHVSPELVPAYTKSFDILAYVPDGGNDFFEIETSPIKLFEYMAAEKPILVSDLPTIKEVLSDEIAFFVPPGISGQDLAKQISIIFKDQQNLLKKASLAKGESLKYAWSNRVRLIENFLNDDDRNS